MTTTIIDPNNGIIVTDTRMTTQENGHVISKTNTVKIHTVNNTHIKYRDEKTYKALAFCMAGFVPLFLNELLQDLDGKDMFEHIHDHVRLPGNFTDRTLILNVLCELDGEPHAFKISLHADEPAKLQKLEEISFNGSGSTMLNVYHKRYPTLTPLEMMAMMVRINIDEHTGGLISKYSIADGNYVNVMGHDVAKELLDSARKKVVAHILG